jgi:unsaturated rhamnogalacturonyl hydrolase
MEWPWWDESRQEGWADKQTGRSANFWARAMGWYGMALVDVLDYIPASHPGHATLEKVLVRYADAIRRVQDPGTGCWWDVLNMGGKKGNYLEASASCMFVYTLAKGARKGYLPAMYRTIAGKGWEGIQKKFVTTDAGGRMDLQGTVSVSGLGGNPYRDGSYAYYIGEKVIPNDPKVIGAFLLAADEMKKKMPTGSKVL